MTIRAELEKRVLDWAAAQSPIVPVALEGVPFNKPRTGSYLRVWFLNRNVVNPSVDASTQRTTGLMQVDCCAPDGLGSGAGEALASNIAGLFPVVPKTGTVSIEQPPQIGTAITLDLFRVVPITISYRQ